MWEKQPFFRTPHPTRKTNINQMKPKIINLSSYKLSKDQIDVLKLGLKFCPTPKSNLMDVKADLKEFERKFRLKEQFLDSKNNDDSIVKNKSKFCPEKGKNRDLDAFFENLWNLELKENTNVRDNLTPKQRKALTDIQNNRNIIIKEADKGSSIVLMDLEYYRTKIQDMLDNETNYRHIDENIDKKITAKIRKLCSKYNTILTKKEQDYLIDFNSKTSNFYGLPKVHKSEEIKKAIEIQKAEYIELHNPEDLKFRPIIAGPACPTHRISNLTDILLQPFLQKIKSHVRDDIHFLNQIPNQTEPDTILTTFDVTSLYSNIPHELGKEAIRYWVEKHPEMLHPRFKGDFIIESLDLILNNNSFQFDDNNYIQILGTAMGTKVAPAYSTLTLAYLEEKLYEVIEQKYGNKIKK